MAKILIGKTVGIVNGEYSISAATWSNKRASIVISGFTTDSVVQVAPADTSAETWLKCGIEATSQGDGMLTFTCTTTPTVDVTANIIILN